MQKKNPFFLLHFRVHSNFGEAKGTKLLPKIWLFAHFAVSLHQNY